MGRIGRRWPRGPASLIAMVAIVLIACGGPTPSAVPPVGEPTPVDGQADPAFDPGPAITARVERDGVLVSLTLEHRRIATGGILNARAEVRAPGLEPVTWQGGGCGLLSDFRLGAPAFEQPPPGRDWPGLAGLVKWSAVPSGIEMTGFLDPGWLDSPFPVVCTADLRIEEIDPGGVEAVDVVWSATTSDGAPTPPGIYRVAFEFPFLGLMHREQFRGDAHADQKPITVELLVEVVGVPFSGIPAPAAIDAALGDPRVAAWLRDKVTRERLEGATLRLEGGVWQFEVRVVGGVTRVRIDPVSGRVLEVGLAD